MNPDATKTIVRCADCERLFAGYLKQDGTPKPIGVGVCSGCESSEFVDIGVDVDPAFD